MKIEIDNKYADAVAAILQRQGNDLFYKGNRGLDLPENQKSRAVQMQSAYDVECGEYLRELSETINKGAK